MPYCGKGRALLNKGNAAVDRAKASRAGTVWTRLNAVDFINSAFQFATYALLCIFPFMIVITAAAGDDFRKVVIARLGLNQQAANDVDGLISSGSEALDTLTVLGSVFLVPSALGIATNLQTWYQQVYDQPTPRDWVHVLANRVVWVTGLLVNLWLHVVVGRQVGPADDHVLIFAALFGIDVLFWWWSAHVLLLGKLSWRALFPAGWPWPCAMAASVCSPLSSCPTQSLRTRRSTARSAWSWCWCPISFRSEWSYTSAVLGRMWNERHSTRRLADRFAPE